MYANKKVTHWIRLGAGLALLGFGGTFLAFGMPMAILGAILIVIGLAVTIRSGYEAAKDRKDRPDPYDLSLLNETSPYRGASRDDPAEEPTKVPEADDDILCIRCQISLPSHYSICPQCGVPLGH